MHPDRSAVLGSRSDRVLDMVGTAVRLGLALVWLVSGTIKASNQLQTTVAVHAYQLLPGAVADVVAGVLPWFELALGVLLLVGLGVRQVAITSAMVLLAFMFGVTQAWARGLAIDCGCFGGGGAVTPDQTSYGTELLRDTGFLILAVWLVVRPRTLLPLERLLNPGEDLPQGGGGYSRGPEE